MSDVKSPVPSVSRYQSARGAQVRRTCPPLKHQVMWPRGTPVTAGRSTRDVRVRREAEQSRLAHPSADSAVEKRQDMTKRGTPQRRAGGAGILQTMVPHRAVSFRCILALAFTGIAAATATAASTGAEAAASSPSSPSPSPRPRGPRQLSDTRYSRVSSSVLSLANDLRALGVDALLEVPALVVAGDQSSGKSSVVEAVAGVPLPRADGTCTRCPTEVRMRSRAGGSAWSCTVKLARSPDQAAGQPLEEVFCTVYDKTHIAAAVTAAQAVLLNPGRVAQQPGGAAAFVPLFPESDQPPFAAEAADNTSSTGSSAAPLPYVTASPSTPPKGNKKGEPSQKAVGPNAGSGVRHSKAYGSLPPAREYEMPFTTDRVVLEISGADADLTIVDLPGIIHNHDGGTHHVEAVQAMVRRQLEPQHHVIVMTLPAMLDQETQVIRLWAREVDPAGQRTIGVITKPDMVPEGQSSMHRKIIEQVSSMPTHVSGPYYHHQPQYPNRHAASSANRSRPAQAAADTVANTSSPRSGDSLRLGCYVVKNPSQEAVQAGITFAEAREDELKYFQGSPHWGPAVAASALLASRTGADNLRDGLSALLVSQIQQQLPDIRARVRERLAAVEAELAVLPPPPSADPLRELRLLLRQAAERLDQQLNGAHGRSKECVQELLGLYDKFGSKVVRSTPAFLVGGKLVGALSQEDKGLLGSSRGISSSTAGGGGGGEGVGKGATGRTTSGFQQVVRLDANGDLDLRAVIRELGKASTEAAAGGGTASLGDDEAMGLLLSHPAVETVLDRWGFAFSFWTLGEVQDLLTEHRGCELPTFPPYDALVDLIGRFKGRWGRHAAECVDDVAAAVHGRAAAVAAELFGRFPRAHSAVGTELVDYIDMLVQEVQAEVAQMVDIEDRDVYVMGNAQFHELEAAFRSRLKKAYLQRDAAAPAAADADAGRRRDEMLDNALHLLKEYGGVSFANFEELFMAQRTPVDDELHMMAACLAYFKSAFLRFKAAVPMRIRGRLLKRVVDPDGVEEAIVGRLVARRVGGGQAEDTEGQRTGGGLGRASEADTDTLERQWAVARELLSEGEALAARRRQLQDMRERLGAAAHRLGTVAF